MIRKVYPTSTSFRPITLGIGYGDEQAAVQGMLRSSQKGSSKRRYLLN